MNLYGHDREAGETTQLTTYRLPVRGGRYSPGAEWIAYTTNETDDLDNLDVYVADADGSDARNLDIGQVGAEATLSDWHPDGGRVLVSDNSTDKRRCGVSDLEAGGVTWYTDERYVESPVAFLRDGSGFLATRRRECGVVPVVYDLDAVAGHELDPPEAVAGSGDTAVLSSSDFSSPRDPERAVDTPAVRPRLDETSTVLEPEYGNLDPDGSVSCEYDTFESHDGLDLEAAGYEAGESGDFEYNELGDEGHGSTDIDRKIRAFRLLGDLLERRVPVDRAAGASD